MASTRAHWRLLADAVVRNLSLDAILEYLLMRLCLILVVIAQGSSIGYPRCHQVRCD